METRTALDLLAKSTILVAVVLLTLLVLRRSSSSARHSVLTTGIVALLLLPVLDAVLPRWETPWFWVRHVEMAAPSAYAAGVPDQTVAQPTAAPLWLMVWGLGFAALLLRAGFSLCATFLARRRPALPEGELRTEIESVTGHRKVRLLVGMAGQSPMTWGWRRPVLMIPPETEFWPTDRVRSVVLHEFAHIRRGDWITQQLAKFACAVYWFHPGVWILARLMEAESERAADDAVICAGCAPQSYARHLLEVAKSVSVTRRPFAVAMARRSSIGARLAAILADGRMRQAPSRRATAVICLIAATFVAAVSGAGPRVIVHVAPALPSPISGPEVAIQAQPVADVRLVSMSDKAKVQQVVSKAIEETVKTARDVAMREERVPSKATPVRAASPATPQNSYVAAAQEEASARQAVALASNQMKAVENVSAKVTQKDLGNGQTLVSVDGIDKDTPDIKVDVPGISLDEGSAKISVPTIHINVPGMHIHVPKMEFKVPTSKDSEDED
jgi:beta-lactamase regulating signal transducer with metallopeptidase domain